MNFSQKNSIVLCTFIYFFFSFPLDFSSILSALCLQFFLLFFFIVFFFLSHIWAFDFFFFFLLRKKRLFFCLYSPTVLRFSCKWYSLCFAFLAFPLYDCFLCCSHFYISHFMFHTSYLTSHIFEYYLRFWNDWTFFHITVLLYSGLPYLFFSRPISYFIFYAFSWSTSILCFNLILIYLSTLLLHSSYILFYMVNINLILRFNAFRKNKKLQ